MNTDKLSRLANVGGATDGRNYGLELTAKNGQVLELGLDEADLLRLVEVVMGLSADAAKLSPEPAPKLASLATPLPVTNLVLMPSEKPENVVLGLQSGKITLTYELHRTTLIKLGAAMQQVSNASR